MSIGFLEALLLGALILLVFGMGKLPTVLGDLGRGLRNFRAEMQRPDAAAETPPVLPSPEAPGEGGGGPGRRP